MNKLIQNRAIRVATYILKQKTTIRKTALYFGISKSTVYKDISERLKYINMPLYNKVKKILKVNKSQRHIRGGLATKIKYQNCIKNV